MPKNREKFVELAEKRVRRAVKDINLIGNLSNRNNYEYADTDVNKIIVALEAAIKDVKNKFKKQGSDSPNEFTLA
jgi:hypothetical protein